jgi:hypothetical protein
MTTAWRTRRLAVEMAGRSRSLRGRWSDHLQARLRAQLREHCLQASRRASSGPKRGLGATSGFQNTRPPKSLAIRDEMSQRTRDRLDGMNRFAVKEKQVEGRQGDQHYRHDAEHDKMHITSRELRLGKYTTIFLAVVV